jgi:hypothetical protein
VNRTAIFSGLKFPYEENSFLPRYNIFSVKRTAIYPIRITFPGMA